MGFRFSRQKEGIPRKIGTDVPQPLTVRGLWAQAVTRQCQIAAGERTVRSVLALSGLIERLLLNLPEPDTAIERLLLRGLLLELALRWGPGIHTEYHVHRPSTCVFIPHDVAIDCWQDVSQRPHDTMRTWARTFQIEFERMHVSVLVTRARVHVETHYSEPLKLSVLADKLGCSARRIARDFRLRSVSR